MIDQMCARVLEMMNTYLYFGLDLNGKGDVKIVVSEERRVDELCCGRPPRLLQVEAALHEVHALRRPVREGALQARLVLPLLLLLLVVALDVEAVEHRVLGDELPVSQ